MNTNVLHELFDGYIRNFELVNGPKHYENYKWEALQEFQSVFDLDAPDFPAMLKAAEKASQNLIDSYMRPFDGLVVMAERNGESERIREMFRSLLADDGGDLDIRQRKINAFLRDCDELLEKHYPGSHLYKNDQRSAMGYLWLNDPEGHYLCKTTEASYFAKCVEFYDSWGTYSDFKLDVYHRFCDEIVAAIKEYPPLLKTHESRFEHPAKPMHPDKNYHILVFDLIYCSETYNLYSGATITQRTPAEVKLFVERKEKAKQLLKAVEEAEADVRSYQAGLDEIVLMLASGASVKHKTYGAAKFGGVEGEYFKFIFDGAEKKFMPPSFVDGFLTVDHPRFQGAIDQYGKVLKLGASVSRRLESAKKALAPYEDYLEGGKPPSGAYSRAEDYGVATEI